jgi:hypothetical protein
MTFRKNVDYGSSTPSRNVCTDLPDYTASYINVTHQAVRSFPVRCQGGFLRLFVSTLSHSSWLYWPNDSVTKGQRLLIDCVHKSVKLFIRLMNDTELHEEPITVAARSKA